MSPYQPRILVIDDEPAILRTVSTTLRLEGYLCETEHDPTAALMRMHAETFHIVITDVVMPEMDGLELVQQIRDSRLLAEIIVMTAFTSLERAVEAYGLGVADYLIKPFQTLDELREVVGRATDRLSRWRGIMARGLPTGGEHASQEAPG